MAFMLSIILLFSLTLAATEAGERRLYSTFTLINHGSSSPSYPLPTMDWADWDVKAPEELTAAGMREQFLLGKELRRRYDNAGLLIPEKIINQVLVRIIDHNNTIDSAQAFLRGFLGDCTDHLTPSELNQGLPPIKIRDYFVKLVGDMVLPYGLGTLPYHTHYPHKEDVFAPCSCRKINHKIHKKFANSSEVNKTRKAYEESFLKIIKKRYEKVDEKLLVFPKYIPLLESLVSILQQYKDAWLTQEEKKIVLDFGDAVFFLLKAGCMTANKYRTAPMISYIGKYFEGSLKNVTREDGLKAAFIFTENRMLTSFLSHLGYNVSATMFPSSIVTLEVHGPEVIDQDMKDAVVVMKYNDMPMRIGNCEFPECKYKDFVKYVKEQEKVLEEVKKECKE